MILRILLIFLIPSTLLATNPSPLDLGSKRFTGVVKHAASSRKNDELVFKNGLFVSTVSRQRGFKAVPYQSTTKGNQIIFEAFSTNTDGETMKWVGYIQGKTVSAHGVYTKKDGTKERFDYEGNLKREVGLEN